MNVAIFQPIEPPKMSVLRISLGVYRLPEVAVSAPRIKLNLVFLMNDFNSQKTLALVLLFHGNTYGETCFKASLGYLKSIWGLFPLLVGNAVGIFNHRPR